jgi:hypothetical protein
LLAEQLLLRLYLTRTMDKEEEQEGLFFLEAFVTLGVTKDFLPG